ncbi:50S ribosomal protein L31, partial [Francisella tularensis subsp. holarctica]|uniref:50S ribosomal protein L31 n=1 Tax=Francisella tularensis TaxID=263 RepID=UPI00238193F9
NTFVTRSTAGKKEMNIDISSECHPFYTGKQRIVDTAGRVDKIKKRFGGMKKYT